MSLKILGKKAFVLVLLFLAMACVYMVKNDKARESYFNSFKSIAWKADIFRGLTGSHADEIKIDLADINMSGLTKNNETLESAEVKTDNSSAVVNKDANVGKENTLENIGEKIGEIAAQVDDLQQEVGEQIALNQIQQQIEQISEQINQLSNEISQFSAITAI
jgi:hypothetical protein